MSTSENIQAGPGSAAAVAPIPAGGVRLRALSRNPSLAATALLVLVVTVGLATLAAFVVLDHRQAARHADVRAAAAAALIEAHTRGTLASVTQLLGRVADRVGPGDPRALRESRVHHEAIRAMAETMPAVVSLIVTDAQGRTMLGARVFPTGPADVSDRDYFRAQLERPEFFIGEMIVGRAAGQRVFTVSLPLHDADGELRGVVAATLDAEIFAGVWDRIDPEGWIFALLRPDGTKIVSHPFDARLDVPGFSDGPAAARPGGESPGHFVGLVPSEHYPVVAAALLPRSAAFERWRKRSALAALIGAVGLGGASLLFLALRKGLAREAELARQKADAYEEVQRSNASLQRLLDYRSVLIRETHHRARNNIQIVSALLSRELGSSSEPGVRAALVTTRTRLSSIARLHEVLYQSDEADQVNMEAFAAKLGAMLRESYALDERGLALAVTASPLRLATGIAVPLGLVINEAVTNAIKHGFPGERRGNIWVTLKQEDGAVILTVEDDGAGLPSGGAERPGGIGRGLLAALVEQLRGEHRLEARRPSGACFSVRIPRDDRQGARRNDR